jgi:hypothetical protein
MSGHCGAMAGALVNPVVCFARERIAAMKQFKGEHEIHREDAVLERPPSLDMSVVDRHE